MMTDRSKPVDGSQNVEQLAADVAEDPLTTHGRRDEERQTDEEAEIGDGQVHNVAVSHRTSHLGVSARCKRTIIALSLIIVQT